MFGGGNFPLAPQRGISPALARPLMLHNFRQFEVLLYNVWNSSTGTVCRASDLAYTAILCARVASLMNKWEGNNKLLNIPTQRSAFVSFSIHLVHQLLAYSTEHSAAPNIPLC